MALLRLALGLGGVAIAAASQVLFHEHQAAKPIVRRSDDQRRLHVGAAGDLADVGVLHQSGDLLAAAGHRVHGSFDSRVGAATDPPPTCPLAFSLGTANSNDCSKDSHRLIYDPAKCEVAAGRFGLPMKTHGNITGNSTADYILLEADFMLYPKGCFKGTGAICSDGASESEECFALNPTEEMPMNPVGQPVCWHRKYSVGKVNHSAVTQTYKLDCGEDYEPITTQMMCENVASCLSIPRGDPFNKNATEYDSHPEGCFRDRWTSLDGIMENRTYYNAPKGDADPTNITSGQPWCIAKPPAV